MIMIYTRNRLFPFQRSHKYEISQNFCNSLDVSTAAPIHAKLYIGHVSHSLYKMHAYWCLRAYCYYKYSKAEIRPDALNIRESDILVLTFPNGANALSKYTAVLKG